ncbi:hypothetical protein E4T39_06244 [Aureobasidium subglaciale]|nr:hypothetical protein E4T39_06244 [Aureobasidium subglaciale]
MRFAIVIFISTSVALLIPRCDVGNGISTIDTRNLGAAPAATATATSSVLASKYPYTKKIKTPSTKKSVAATTPLATRAVTTEVEEVEACVPHSICVDKISPCGKRYGGCYDENFCDGNTSPYPIPTCPTMVTKKRAAAPAITAA